VKIGGRSIQRGVLLLPSLLTLGNLFCGLNALREATAGRFGRAAVFIVIGIIFDGLDGKIARLANATSPLGIQLDSLSDVVSFGVAPALLVYWWALDDLGRLGWAMTFVFTSCGTIRLARFNLQAAPTESRDFVGLPIPGAAGAIASLVLLFPDPLESSVAIWATAVLTVSLALLMVSTVRYRSFKKVDVKRRHPARTLLWVVAILAVVWWHPPASLASAALLYILSGPVTRVLTLLGRARDARRETSPPADDVR